MSYQRASMLSLSLIFCLWSLEVSAQDPTRFAETIERYNSEERAFPDDQSIVFVGSSSIRKWESLTEDFPDHKVINRGFGGSVMSDLFYYWKELILAYQPKQIFIYEGDNDISRSKSTNAIMDTTKLLVSKIRASLPNTTIVFIAAKPSVERWHRRKNYLLLNEALSEYTCRHDYLDFANIWDPMLGDNGLIRSDLFIKDGLHMNAKGYEIWTKVIGPLLK